MNNMDRLKGNVEKSAARLRKAERERGTILSYTAYLGTLGMLTAGPVVAGAFLGRWLDEKFGAYIFTLLLVFAGVAIGAVNIYLYLRE